MVSLGNVDYSPILPIALNTSYTRGKLDSLSYNQFSVFIYMYVAVDDVMTAMPNMWEIIEIVIPKIQADWKYVAYSLRYQTALVKAFETDSCNSKDACLQLFEDWLCTNNGITPKDWNTLLDRIKAVDNLQAVAENIKVEIISRFS